MINQKIDQTEREETISSQINSKFFELLDKSTFHGLPNIFLTKNIFRKIFWLIATLVSYCYCAFLVTNNILEYNKYEVVTRYESIYENEPPFPLVFFCDHNRKKTKCIFNGEICPETYKLPNDECEEFNHAYDFDTGTHVPLLKSREYGSGSGLQLKLHAKSVYTAIPVYISNHSKTIVTDPRYISPGLRTTFVIKRIFESRLPAPYSDCRINVTGSKKLDELNKVYYKSLCLIYCRYYLIAENCNLLDKFLDISHLFYTDIDFNKPFNSTIKDTCDPLLYDEAHAEYYKIGANEACKNICPVECNSFSLSFSSFYEKLPDAYSENYAELNVFYDTFDYTFISQTPKITSDRVLGTIGGLIGLFLGASLLSFGDLIDLLFSVVRVLIVTSKNVTVYNYKLADIVQINHVKKHNKKLKNRDSFKISSSIVTRLQRFGILSDFKNHDFRQDRFHTGDHNQ